MNTTERLGVSKVQLIVYEKLHWIFREQPIDDCGIDAHIELMDDNCATGKLIAVQIKSGESYFKNESNNEVVNYIEDKHLNYWKSNVLPVIIVLYNPKTEECIWEYIGNIREKNKIYISKLHKFDANAKDELTKIASIEPYRMAQIHRRNYIEKNKSLEILMDLVHTKRKKEIYNFETQISIDFGTTKTMIGVISENGDITLIKTQEDKNYFDTVIGFDENYQYYIGADALKRKYDPSIVIIRNFKRELGFNKKYKIFGLTISAEDITTLFLQAIINYIEIRYDVRIKKCCVSDPIDFSYYQKKAYEECLKKCGLTINKIISESTCVSISPKGCHDDKKVVTIDMGGGTFDISFIEMGQGVIDVLYTIGDRTIGGIDYDFALGKYIKRYLLVKYPGILIDSLLENQIDFKAEEVKILLSTEEKATVFLTDCYCTERETTIFCSVEIGRNDFRRATDYLNVKVENILTTFKEEISAYASPSEIIIGGAGNKIFTVNEIIEKYFHQIPILNSYSEKKVIEGLTRYSGKLLGLEYARNMLLLDVIGYDIILECEKLFSVYNVDTSKWEKEILQFRLAERDYTIPTQKNILIRINCNQQIAILIACGQHEDRVLTYNFKNISKESIFKVKIDISSNRSIYGVIKDFENQNVVWEFML